VNPVVNKPQETKVEEKKTEKVVFGVAAITVSDWAHEGQYRTGDLSGAAIREFFHNSD